jgi:hypothetical protein
MRGPCQDVKQGIESDESAMYIRDKPIFSSEKMLHEDYDRKGSVEKKLIVSLEMLDAMTN